MERLTQRSTWDGGVYFAKTPKGFFCYENPCSQAIKCEKVDDKTCPHLAILERLAEYEDTGLEPESVKQMQDVFGRGITFLEDARERLEIIEGISTDRLRDMVESDREGRCHIGRCVECSHYEGLAVCEFLGDCGGTNWICGWFEPRQDAEVALKGERDG